MENSEASYNSDSGFYIGQTPKQTTPDALDRAQRQVVRQRARLLGHQHALRDDHEVAVVQQRHRHRPQRAGQREVRAAGGQRHHRQRHLLEQLQLLRGRAVQAEEAGDRRRPTRSASASCSSAAAATEVSHNRIYGNYLVGVGALKQILLKQADAADLIGNQVHDNQFGLGGADLNGRELFYDGSGLGQLLRPQRRRRRHRRRPTARPSPRARSPGANAFNQAAQDEAISWSVGDPTHEAFWIKHPHAAKSGLTPLEHYKK